MILAHPKRHFKVKLSGVSSRKNLKRPKPLIIPITASIRDLFIWSPRPPLPGLQPHYILHSKVAVHQCNGNGKTSRSALVPSRF